MARFEPNPNLERDLQREITQKVPEGWNEALEEVTCPDHGEHPRFVADPGKGWRMEGCCETVLAMGKEKMGWSSE